MEEAGITRRAFITGTAAVAGTLGLTGSIFANCATAEEASAAVTSYYQCADDWLGLPPETGDPATTYDCDILVIGSGHSGIQAALAAAEGGAKVMVIEKVTEENRKVKGEDIGHINSQWLIDQGYGPYDVGEVTREFVRRAAGRCNQEVIRKFVANSGEMFDHLQSLCTWPNDRIKCMDYDENPELSPFDPSQVICQVSAATKDGPVEYPIMCGGNGSYAAVAQFMGTISHDNSHPGCAAMSRIDEVQQSAMLAAQDLGAEWHFGEAGVKLLTDKSGAVIGAISQKVDDQSYIQYNTKTGVIMCAGDFGGNSKMTWNLIPEIAERNSRQGLTVDDLVGYSDCVGDGQKMVCWAGGVMQVTPRGAMNNEGGGGGPWGTCPYLFLNSAGMRFCNEANSVGLPAATLDQPLGIVTTVTDANYYTTIKYAGLDHGAPNYGRPDYITELVDDMTAIELENTEGGQVRDSTIAERDPCTVYASATLEGALKLAGYSGDALTTALDQVAKYNELCKAGIDSQYGKDAQYLVPVDTAPFYTSTTTNTKTTDTGLVTLAGVTTDDDLRAINAAGDVIPNLWVAGNCLGGRYGNTYATPFAGNSIGMACTHGRVAGKLATGQEIS